MVLVCVAWVFAVFRVAFHFDFEGRRVRSVVQVEIDGL
jgi:hypothetical protein